MKAMKTLPEGYNKLYAVDLQKDKKTALLVNLLALIISLLLIVPMHFFVPITTLFDMGNGLRHYILRFLTIIVLIVVYMVLHELVHGVAMKLCGTEKVKYGFNGIYAFAGSSDYYSKKAYVCIALAPIVLWGIVLAAINVFAPIDWFWVVYIIQVMNISGAAGDLFVTVRFSRFPKDILVQDHGVGMVVYSRSER